MPNQKLALEWLSFAEKNLETALLLNKENHYTDVIAIDIQQAVEKALKSIYAYNGDKIPRTHSLEILYNYAENFVNLNDISKKDLLIISDYYQSERYPGPKYFMPERKEIAHLTQVAKDILFQIQQFIKQA
jgi:HEPN domain-containing protein